MVWPTLGLRTAKEQNRTFLKLDPKIITKLLSIFGCRKKDPQTASDDCATIFLM